MNIRGIMFDLNGTLININTDESYHEIYRFLANLLIYQGIQLSPEELRDLYFRLMKTQRRSSVEQYPEFDVVGIFRDIIEKHGTRYTRSLCYTKAKNLPLFLAEAYRAASLNRLEIYPGVMDTLDDLIKCYKLTAVTDGQSPWALAELRGVGLGIYFPEIIASGDLGYRKPDRRIFDLALRKLRLPADQVVFVGNDMYRDIFGAQQLGMKTVFFRSNQGGQHHQRVNPDYIISYFPELLDALYFFKKNGDM
ncbi:MAG: HAD family hydrolase [Desulfobulbaceae bacterium]|nr:HAD family hydrolase [Desulfobulbaceae bacterium]